MGLFRKTKEEKLLKTLYKSGSKFKSVSKGKIGKALELIEDGADINTKRKNGYFNPLLLSVRAGSVEVLEKLIEKGVDINAKTYNGDTALIYAAQLGRTEMVEKLIKKGAKIDAQNDHGKTALIEAVCSDGNTFVQNYKGHDAVIEGLLRAGANVNLKDSNGHTALYYARVCYRKRTAEIIKAEAKPMETWEVLGDCRILCTVTFPQQNKVVTEMFNFASGQQLIKVRNFETERTMSFNAVPFKDINQSYIDKAKAEFNKQKGIAVKTEVRVIPKKKAKVTAKKKTAGTKKVA